MKRSIVFNRIFLDHSIGLVATKLGYFLDTGGAVADIVELTEKEKTALHHNFMDNT